MVEYTFSIDSIFSCLADPTRRDILHRLSEAELNVSEIAEPYDMSLAAVSKHLTLLEQACLITKRRQGRRRLVQARPSGLQAASDYLRQYEQMWQSRFNKLDNLLNEEE